MNSCRAGGVSTSVRRHAIEGTLNERRPAGRPPSAVRLLDELVKDSREEAGVESETGP
jgi:hypothetical protein